MVAALLIVAQTLLLYRLTRVASAGVLGAVYLLGVLLVAIGWGFWLAAATSRLSPGNNVGTVSIPNQGGPRKIYRYRVTNARGDTAFPISSPHHCGEPQANSCF